MNLSYSQRAYVVARHRDGFVKLGGLGALGVGEMWVVEVPEHADYPGYAEAAVVDEEPTTLLGQSLRGEASGA